MLFHTKLSCPQSSAELSWKVMDAKLVFSTPDFGQAQALWQSFLREYAVHVG